MKALVSLAALVLPLPAFAETAPMPLTYQIFEAAVPHVDLAACPVELAAEGVFCRLALLNEEIHVFVFSEEGDQPMVNFRSWSVDLMAGLMD